MDNYLIQSKDFNQYYDFKKCRELSFVTSKIFWKILDEINSSPLLPYKKNSCNIEILIAPWLIANLEVFIDRTARIYFRKRHQLHLNHNLKYLLEGDLPISLKESFQLLNYNKNFQEWLLSQLYNQTSTQYKTLILQQDDSIEPQSSFIPSNNFFIKFYYSLLFRFENIKKNIYFFLGKKIKKSKLFAIDIWGIKNSSYEILYYGLYSKNRSFQPLKKNISLTQRQPLASIFIDLLNKHKSELFNDEIFSLFEKDHFIHVFAKWLSTSFPLSLLEDFEENLKSGIQFYNEIGRPTHLLSSIGIYSDESYLFLALAAKLNNSKLIGFQHGGNYGHSGVYSLHTIIEGNFLDRFYSWGWEEWDRSYLKINTLNNVKPMPSIFLSSLKKRVRGYKILKDKQKGILFIASQVPDYTYIFNQFPKSDFASEYTDEEVIVLKELRRYLPINEEILYKTYFFDYKIDSWEMKKKKINQIPNIHFTNKGFAQDLCYKYRLSIVNNIATFFLISIAYNLPVIMYIRKDYFNFSANGEKDFLDLIRVGIVYRDLSSFLKAIPNILNEINAWWFEQERQNIIKTFSRKQCWIEKNSKSIWKREFDSYNRSF